MRQHKADSVSGGTRRSKRIAGGRVRVFLNGAFQPKQQRSEVLNTLARVRSQRKQREKSQALLRCVPKSPRTRAMCRVRREHARLAREFTTNARSYGISWEVDSNPEYIIDRILNRCKSASGAVQYYVSWKGYNSSHNMWIPYQLSFRKLAMEFDFQRAYLDATNTPWWNGRVDVAHPPFQNFRKQRT